MKPRSKPWEDDYRIPNDTYANHYDLYLHPDLEAGTFSGKVTVHITALNPRDFFVVHKKYHTITKTELRDTAGNKINSTSTDYPPNEFWVVEPEAEVEAGNYTIYMEFNGSLTEHGILGFYKSTYVDSNGRTRAIATSKFQPTYARRAFPCFDEPSFKSTFNTTLVRPSGDGYIALSNMPEASAVPDSPSPGETEVTFEKSVPMVSYLAIFVVCDFEHLESNTPENNIPFRVYGTSTQVKERLNYAVDVGRSITDYYWDYFAVPYPLPKLDMAAIPDYSSGATEHWGLITFRETNLIYNELESSSYNQFRVASVIAHELVHQWFGNLVTLEWWNDLWLNEGFATYLSYQGVKRAEPEWDTESMFLTGDLHGVLDLDATVSSRAIVMDVDTPDQINAVFDTISYSKGSSVIRMMENFMGTEDFKAGITKFLEDFSYKNAVTQDLFDSLEAATDLPITEIMNTWIRQKGYPVLMLDRSSDNKTYTVTQERFLTDPEANETEVSEYNYKWEVPLTYITSGNPERTLTWLSRDNASIEITVPAGTKWTKFNVGQYGYYRVQYPLAEWQQFGELLQTDMNALSTLDRTCLLNDAFSLADGGRLNYTTALDLTKYLGAERSHVAWSVMGSRLAYFHYVFYYTPLFESLIAYERGLVNELQAELGWSDEGSFGDKSLRVIILETACAARSEDCLRTAEDKFSRWLDDGQFIAPNLREIVYKYGIPSDKAVWDRMLEKYLSETNAQEKSKLLRGLTSVKDPWLLYRLIEMGRNETIIREQDYFSMLSYISYNRVGEPIVWDFVRNEWEYLVERFTLNDRYLGSLIPTITKKFATEMRLREMKDFFQKYPDAGAGEQNRQVALETVSANIQFVENYSDTIKEWLEANTEDTENGGGDGEGSGAGSFRGPSINVAAAAAVLPAVIGRAMRS